MYLRASPADRSLLSPFIRLCPLILSKHEVAYITTVTQTFECQESASQANLTKTVLAGGREQRVVVVSKSEGVQENCGYTFLFLF